ncbi:MAG: PAS domain S-box protein [Ignavibacteriales bacterium]|nr:PAS domain S-box protein [Ignavibacteriales bacterium]
MLKNLTKLFLPPEFPDHEKTRTAKITHYISGGLFLLFIIPLIYNLNLNLEYAAMILLAEEIILAITFILNRKAGNRSSTTLMSFSMPVMASLLIVTSMYGVHDIALLIYPAGLVVGGLLLEKKSFIVFTGFTIVIMILLFLAELNGISHTRLSSYVTHQDLIDAVLIILITAFLVNLLTNNFLKNIQVARQNQKQLGLMNEELKKYSDLLKLSEEKYRFITDHINDLVGQVAPDGAFIYASPSYETTLGYKPVDLVGKHFSIFVNEKNVESLNDSILKAIKSKCDHISAEVWVNHKNGTPILFDANISLIYKECGELERLQIVSRDVTQQRISAEILKKSAQEWQNTFDALHDPIFLLGPDYKILRANKSTKTYFGFEPDEILGKHCWEVIHNSTAPLNECPVFQLEKTMKRASTELMIGTKWFEVIVDPIFDGKNELSGIVHIARDITNKKQAEDALRNEKLRLESASIAGKVALWEWDIPSGIIEWSDEIYRMLGYPRDKLFRTYNQFEQIIHPEDYNNVINALNLHFNNHAHFNLDYRVKRFDDKYIWWHIVGNAQFDISGHPYRMAGVCVDISERKQAEEVIAAEKERLLVTLRSIGEGVITTNIDGKIILMNGPSEQYTGWNITDCYNINIENIIKLIDPKSRYAIENPVSTILRSKSISEICLDAILVSKDGTERMISIRTASIYNNTKNIIGAILVLRDITEKQRIEENIHNAAKLDSIGILAGGIAHDFNNLLNGIFGYLELAINRGSRDEKLIAYLNKAIGVFERARNLTHQLFTFAKGSKPIKKIVELDSLIHNNVNFVLSGSSITAKIIIPSDLKVVEIDEHQFNQALDNILLNAIQSMQDNGTITIKAENCLNISPLPGKLPERDYICIIVQDEGCGIPEYNLPRIFDPFFTTKEKGTGLGLATSYSIIKKHDGYIDVKSEVGKGSVFSIYIPASGKESDLRYSNQTTGFTGSGKVLLMDDESYIIDLGSEMLKLFGYSVVTAKSGEEAIELFRLAAQTNEPIKIAILDLTIPGGMGGREAIKVLLEIDSSLKAIASSGYSEDPVMADPKPFGFHSRLIKPYRKDDLSRALSECND